ncbi:TPA: hypothetical protein MDW71_005246 [Klebsiella pneumoniae]|nr:hypothetical protein [Klebsiella pneumoniae]
MMVIMMAEYLKNTPDVEADVFEFDDLDALIKFRKDYPEKMKYNYHYALCKVVTKSGSFCNEYVNVVEADHFKKFKKLMNAR